MLWIFPIVTKNSFSYDFRWLSFRCFQGIHFYFNAHFFLNEIDRLKANCQIHKLWVTRKLIDSLMQKIFIWKYFYIENSRHLLYSGDKIFEDDTVVTLGHSISQVRTYIVQWTIVGSTYYTRKKSTLCETNSVIKLSESSAQFLNWRAAGEREKMPRGVDVLLGDEEGRDEAALASLECRQSESQELIKIDNNNKGRK